MSDKIYTASTLAERWLYADAQPIVKLRKQGKLIGFGDGKGWRITLAEIEAYEGRWTTASDVSEKTGSPSGTTRTEEDIAGDLARKMRFLRERRLEHSRTNVTALRAHRSD